MESAERSESRPTSLDFGTPEDVLNVLYGIRDALTEMLSATGADVTKTRATARQLGLDRNLIWRVTHVMNSRDILSATREIPSRKQIVKLCQVCEEHGASAEMVQKVIASIDLFERMIEVSLGNREDFETMLISLGQEDVTTRQEHARKQAFLANSTIWGVQSKVNFKACITAPSREEPDKMEVVQITGLVDFRRLRPVPWPLSRSHAYSGTGEVLAMTYDSIEQDEGRGADLPLLTAFSSKPAPEINCIPTAYGKLYELASGPIGNAGACTCIFAEKIHPHFERYRTAREAYHATMIDLVTPSEHLILDMFLHRELDCSGPPEAMLLDRLSSVRGYHPELDAKFQLPLSVQPIGLGSSAAGTATPQFPLYPKILSHVLDSLGWRHEDFEGFRLSLKYPPVPSATLIRIPLGEKPGDCAHH